MEVKTISKTISYGKLIYRINSNGGWSILTYGVHSPSCNGIPSYRFVHINSIDVPNEVKKG